MSDDNNPGGKNDDAGGKTVSYESFQKLLSEKKALQSKFDTMNERLDSIEAEKLELQGDLKKQNERLKEQLKESKDKHLGTVKKVAEKVIKQQFMREAEKLGCVDAEAAFKLISTDDINITEDFEFDSKALSTKLETFTKEKPFMFKKAADAPRDGIPAGGGLVDKPVSEMTTDEKWTALSTIK